MSFSSSFIKKVLDTWKLFFIEALLPVSNDDSHEAVNMFYWHIWCFSGFTGNFDYNFLWSRVIMYKEWNLLWETLSETWQTSSSVHDEEELSNLPYKDLLSVRCKQTWPYKRSAMKNFTTKLSESILKPHMLMR